MLNDQACKSVSRIGGMIGIFGDLLDIGGMILIFAIFGSCYAQTHAFSTHFCEDLFFFLARLFSHIFCKNPYQYLSYLASSIPPDIFQCHDGGKILGNSQQWAKIEIIGGNRGQILGGMYPPIPPGFAALKVINNY